MLLSMPTAAALTQSCESTLGRLRSATQAILHHRGRPTFLTVTLPLENAMSDGHDALALDRFASEVAPDPDVRDASRRCEAEAKATIATIESSAALYDAMLAASKTSTGRAPDERALGEAWLATLRRSGAAVGAAHRIEFFALVRELADLQTTFAANLQADDTTIVLGRHQLGGLPKELLANATRGRDGLVVPVNAATHDLLRYATDETARHIYWTAYEHRAWQSNVAVFERALAVRDRMAHLLGFESWADYRLAGTMAGSSVRVEKFLASAIDELRAPAEGASERLRQAIAAEERRDDATLQPWDVAHAEYLVARADAPVDANLVREYFPAQHTLDAVLQVCHTIFGIDFAPIDATGAWSPNVSAYQVTDALSGGVLGYTYVDLSTRPEQPATVANVTLLPARVVGDTRRPPVTVLVGSWPALLEHDDVARLFRALGANLAALLATPPYETLNQRARADSGETPPLVLERLAWQPAILAQITATARTSEAMPQRLIDELVNSRSNADAYTTMQSLDLAMLDVRGHSSGGRIQPGDAWSTPAASLVMSGYDAELYAGLWSRAYAADLFTAFAAAPLDPATGMRFRTTILAPGYGQDTALEAANFLGRPTNLATFFSEFGR